MSNSYKSYSAGVSHLTSLPTNGLCSLNDLKDWYISEGRELFKIAFKDETGLSVPTRQNPDTLIGNAVPKNFNDLEKKMRSKPYYRSHAQWFVEEMDNIISFIPSQTGSNISLHANQAVFSIARMVLMDSKILISDYGDYVLGIPNVYGIGKNFRTHNVHLYHSAKQIIYGHGSYGLSAMDNHADTSIGIIRQSIELKMMKVFGIRAKIKINGHNMLPISLSSLFEVINPHKKLIAFPLKFESIIRTNGWANMYLHTGQKEYAWCPSRVLSTLRPFLLAQKNKPHIQTDTTTFQRIRDDFVRANELKEDGTANGYKVILNAPSDCDINFSP